MTSKELLNTLPDGPLPGPPAGPQRANAGLPTGLHDGSTRGPDPDRMHQFTSSDGTMFTLYESQLRFYRESAERGFHQPRNFQTFKKIFSYVRPRNVIDVGAHVGFNTVQYAKYADTVFSFEPCTRTRRLLYRNIYDNHLRNVSAYGCAIGKSEGVVMIETFSRDGCNRIADKGSESVRVVPLDDLFCVNDDIDYVKIDVEGAELGVLEGAQRLLVRSCPAVQTEVVIRQLANYGTTRSQILTFMRDLGYTPYTSSLKPITNIDSVVGDIFWLHDDNAVTDLYRVKNLR